MSKSNMTELAFKNLESKTDEHIALIELAHKADAGYLPNQKKLADRADGLGIDWGEAANWGQVVDEITLREGLLLVEKYDYSKFKTQDLIKLIKGRDLSAITEAKRRAVLYEIDYKSPVFKNNDKNEMDVDWQMVMAAVQEKETHQRYYVQQERKRLAKLSKSNRRNQK